MADATADFLGLTLDFSDCPWLAYAAQEASDGVREDTRAGKSNPRVDQYLRTVGLSDDATPWCSAFVNWCVTQAGLTGTNRGNARSWLQWGVPMAQCRLGSVAVFTRGNNNWQGHVAFYVGDQGNNVLVLGGNQGNRVCVKTYARSRLLGMRWPYLDGPDTPS